MSETPGWSSPDQPQNQPPQQQPPQYGQQQYGYNAPPPPPTIKPGVIPLRPLALGEIIDGAITTMRRYPKLIIGAAAVVAAITQIVGLLVQLPFLADLSTALDPSAAPSRDQLLGVFASALGGTLLGIVLQLVGTVFLSGFITVVAGHAVLGRQVTFAQAWEEFKPRLLPLLGSTLLYGLLIMAAPIVLGLLGVLANSGWALALGLFVAFLVAVWLWVMFSLVTPALVLERCGVGTAFSRSSKLVSGAWWRTFGILLVAGMIAAVISWIIGLPFELLGRATTGFDSDPAIVLSAGYLIMITLGSIIASTIALPFSSAVSVLVYVDRRMRSEGMDIELQRAAGHGGS
jgi:hypothetical protein